MRYECKKPLATSPPALSGGHNLTYYSLPNSAKIASTTPNAYASAVEAATASSITKAPTWLRYVYCLPSSREMLCS